MRLPTGEYTEEKTTKKKSNRILAGQWQASPSQDSASSLTGYRPSSRCAPLEQVYPIVNDYDMRPNNRPWEGRRPVDELIHKTQISYTRWAAQNTETGKSFLYTDVHTTYSIPRLLTTHTYLHTHAHTHTHLYTPTSFSFTCSFQGGYSAQHFSLAGFQHLTRGVSWAFE